MTNKNIVLTGFMASGKTLVSNKLGKILKREVISVDQCIEEREDKAILDIFKEKKEPYFRQIEKDIIREISQRNGIIIDCGGGAVLEKVNIDNLKKHGIILFLSASPELVYGRVKGKKDRPILNVEDPLGEIKKLMKIRQPFYAQAEHIIEVDNKTINQVCKEITGVLGYNLK